MAMVFSIKDKNVIFDEDTSDYVDANTIEEWLVQHCADSIRELGKLYALLVKIVESYAQTCPQIRQDLNKLYIQLAHQIEAKIFSMNNALMGAIDRDEIIVFTTPDSCVFAKYYGHDLPFESLYIATETLQKRDPDIHTALNKTIGAMYYFLENFQRVINAAKKVPIDNKRYQEFTEYYDALNKRLTEIQGLNLKEMIKIEDREIKGMNPKTRQWVNILKFIQKGQASGDQMYLFTCAFINLAKTKGIIDNNKLKIPLSSEEIIAEVKQINKTSHLNVSTAKATLIQDKRLDSTPLEMSDCVNGIYTLTVDFSKIKS